MTAPSSDRLLAALTYARRGWPVFPVHAIDALGRCTCSNPECRDPGKHPRTDHGFKDATTDERQIGAWWSIWPEANVGIATGSVSGLVVVDVDQQETPTGLLELLGPEAGKTPTVRTGGGGLHMYFQHPGERVPNRTHVMGLSVDVRGDGGCIIAPPSSHASGNTYYWICDGDPPGMPEALLTALRASEPRVVTAEADVIYEGSRNDTLTRLAGSMRRAGSSLETLSLALFAENALRCRPLLDAAEIDGIVRSSSAWEPGAPLGTEASRVGEPLRCYSIAELRQLAPERPDWRIESYIANGMLTTLTSKPKVGKTTLLMSGIKAMSEGAEFLGRETRPGPVVYLTEESPSTFNEAVARAGLTDEQAMIVVPRFVAYGRQWPEVIDYVRGLLEPLDGALLVVDTLPDWVSFASDWENNSGMAKEAMRPLRRIANDGHAVLCVLHQRKGGGSIHDNIRGSSAFAGDADILITLDERAGPANGRTLTSSGRPTAANRKVHIEFDGSTFQLAAETDAPKTDKARRLIVAMLGDDEGEAVLLKDIVDRLKPVCSDKTVQRVLDRLEAGDDVTSKPAKTGTNRVSKAYWRPRRE